MKAETSSNIIEHQEVKSEDNIEQLLVEANAAVQATGGIMEGVGKFKRVLELDSNNIEALYSLGILSIQSNQLKKAKDRFKKLILLQPQNQEYKKVYNQILVDLGEQ